MSNEDAVNLGGVNRTPLHPVGDRVLVALEQVKEHKVGGLIYAPDMNHSPTRFGVVLRVGGDVTRYKPGDMVFMGYHAGTVIDRVEFGYKADTLRIVTEGEIWGFVQEEAADGDMGLRPTEG